jgi:hypothetical protein
LTPPLTGEHVDVISRDLYGGVSPATGRRESDRQSGRKGHRPTAIEADQMIMRRSVRRDSLVTVEPVWPPAA